MPKNHINNSFIFDNFIYIFYFLIVVSFTIFLFGGLDNYLNLYKINADNNAYHKIFLKLESLFNNQYIDIENNIAIPGLSFFIFIFAKIFFLKFDYAFFLLMFFCYIFSLNFIRLLSNSSISYFSLIFGWEFIMTTTTGGTEPVIFFFLYSSLYFYKVNKINLAYFLILLGALTKPFMVSVYLAYTVFKFFNNKLNFYKIMKICVYIIFLVTLFFIMSHILYNNINNIINMYSSQAWLTDDKIFNIPLIIFFKTMFGTIYKLDNTFKILFYFFLHLVPIIIALNKKIYLDKNINLYFFILLFYFLIVIFYPSIWSYYEFVRFISPVTPLAIYLLFQQFDVIKNFFSNKITVSFLLVSSALFYACANYGIKNFINLIFF
jgi:hypothetical protein